MNFGMFEHNIRAPKFTRLNSFGDTFGSRFTFEMAEEIFNSAFQEPRQYINDYLEYKELKVLFTEPTALDKTTFL